MPTEVKILNGTRADRIKENEPRPRIGKPKCPPWLDAEAKRKWRQLVRELSPLGLFTAIDGDALATYCVAWSELRTATETLQREGRTIQTQSGYLAPHPAVAMQRSAWQAIKSFAALFGLDPADRSRLNVPAPRPGGGIMARDRNKSRFFPSPEEQAEDDALEEFMRERDADLARKRG